jgi:hypothetical protein
LSGPLQHAPTLNLKASIEQSVNWNWYALAKKSPPPKASSQTATDSKNESETNISYDEFLRRTRVRSQVRGAVRIEDGLTRKEIEAEKASALALMRSFDAKDWPEAMLAAQMVAAHNLAMELSHQALNTSSFSLREQMLKHTAKLMGLYSRQLEALGKYRGNGQQNIRVEHVNVAPGAQAIVGNVATTANAGSTAPAAPVPMQISHKQQVPFEMPEQASVAVERQSANAESTDDT